jgi:hypothetical protein
MEDHESRWDDKPIIYPLVEIIMSQLWFLERCDDAVLDSRTAGKQMDEIAY